MTSDNLPPRLVTRPSYVQPFVNGSIINNAASNNNRVNNIFRNKLFKSGKDLLVTHLPVKRYAGTITTNVPNVMTCTTADEMTRCKINSNADRKTINNVINKSFLSIKANLNVGGNNNIKNNYYNNNNNNIKNIILPSVDVDAATATATATSNPTTAVW